MEGFAQRSGIEVKIDLPDDVARLPKPIELGLFRALQESLTIFTAIPAVREQKLLSSFSLTKLFCR